MGVCGRVIVRLCRVCRTIQRAGRACGICRAPVEIPPMRHCRHCGRETPLEEWRCVHCGRGRT